MLRSRVGSEMCIRDKGYTERAAALLKLRHRHAGVAEAQPIGAGAIGVWTKADSVTEFDDFSYGGQWESSAKPHL